MVKLFQSKEMQRVDRAAVKEFAMKGLQLMELGGAGVARACLRDLEGKPMRRVAIVAGKGNNGGDGFVVARHLVNNNVDVRVFSICPLDDYKGESLINARVWKEMGGATSVVRSLSAIKSHSSFFAHSSLIVDALLGTGLNSNLRGIVAALVDFINSLSAPVLSVDIPSGVCADNGAVMGRAVRAKRTVTMAAPKLGLYLYPGRELAGEVEVVDIGLPRPLIDDPSIRTNLIDDLLVRSILRERPLDSHKGDFGHLLVIAGSRGKSGAAYLSATAAMRAGAGLVTLALPQGLNAAMETKTTEVMTAPLAQSAQGGLSADSLVELKKLVKGKSAVVIGPGLGLSDDTTKVVRGLLTSKGIKLPPVLLDADALNCIAPDIGFLSELPAQVVLTPHPGEAARLLGVKVKDVVSDSVASARAITEKTGAVTLLKGASSVISLPSDSSGSGQIYINPTGTPALSGAGSGDVLSGMIGAFMANGYSACQSALCGAYLHGIAGEKLTDGGRDWGGKGGPAGVIASDLLNAVPRLVNCFSSPAHCGC